MTMHARLKLPLVGISLLLLNVAAPAQEHPWTHVGKAGFEADVYVNDKSIKAIDAQYRVVIELINYRDADNRERSLVSGSMYDCVSPRKRDQFVTEYSQHWGLGTRSSSSSVEDRWFNLKPKSIGADIQTYVCEKSLQTTPAT